MTLCRTAATDTVSTNRMVLPNQPQPRRKRTHQWWTILLLVVAVVLMEIHWHAHLRTLLAVYHSYPDVTAHGCSSLVQTLPTTTLTGHTTDATNASATETTTTTTARMAAVTVSLSNNSTTTSTPHAATVLVVHDNASNATIAIDTTVTVTATDLDSTVDVHANETAVCILHANNTSPYLPHFPHFLESLAPCWSHVCRVRERTMSPTANCFLYIDERVQWHSPWTDEFLSYMGCTVVNDGPSRAVLENYPSANVWNPDYLEMRDPATSPWFEQPHHAHLLAQRVLRHSAAVTTMLDNRNNDNDNGTTISIGLVYRPLLPTAPNRAFLNLFEMANAIRHTFPNATLTATDFSQASVVDQAAFVHSHDIVILAHGAAATNALFLYTAAWGNDDKNDKVNTTVAKHHRPPAALIEIFPGGFYQPMYQNLVRRSGNARYYALYRQPVHFVRGHGERFVDMLVDVPKLVATIQQALDDQNGSLVSTS
jgi:Glycosyltransferase 61